MKLEEGEEIIGIADKVYHEDDNIKIIFIIKKEIEIPYFDHIMKKLTSLVGRRIGILRTDIPGKYFLIKDVIEKTNSKTKRFLTGGDNKVIKP